MTQNYADRATLLEALQWHIDHGADALFVDIPADRTAMPAVAQMMPPPVVAQPKAVASNAPLNTAPLGTAPEMAGAAQALEQARVLAKGAQTLEELATAIKNFEGLSIRKTATNMVFADGRGDAPIMVIGEAPAAEEDIQAKPFVGPEGQLLDKILASIGLSRAADDIKNAAYLTNLLNWRPPGGRTPTQAEQQISLEFLHRHIALKRPQYLIFLGGNVAKAALGKTESISRLRGKMHAYQSPSAPDMAAIPALVTYHPEYLLKTPAQKRAVWEDMQFFQAEYQKA